MPWMNTSSIVEIKRNSSAMGSNASDAGSNVRHHAITASARRTTRTQPGNGVLEFVCLDLLYSGLIIDE